MFKKTYEFFNQKFFLILLSPDNKEEIIEMKISQKFKNPNTGEYEKIKYNCY